MSKWKLVPVEPTDKMIFAGWGESDNPTFDLWQAMLAAAPVPVADDCDGILDCYAAENQQFSDEIAQLRAEVESARTKAIALESRRDAWRDSAILSQRSASGLAQQVDQQSAELARLCAENERLKGVIDKIIARTLDGPSYRMAQEIHDIAIDATMARGKV